MLFVNRYLGFKVIWWRFVVVWIKDYHIWLLRKHGLFACREIIYYLVAEKTYERKIFLIKE